MNLSEKELNELKSQIAGLHCPACGGTDLVPSEQMFQDLSLDAVGDRLDFSNKYAYRNVAKVICQDCGFLMSFARKDGR